eukprot:scaffold3717_cov124-Isochrysis_galbana.AAC.3
MKPCASHQYANLELYSPGLSARFSWTWHAAITLVSSTDAANTPKREPASAVDDAFACVALTADTITTLSATQDAD